MATNNNVKPWDKPWSMDEIIDHSDRWNLAGDAALLSTVTDLANNLLSKTLKINDNVDGLLNELDEVSVKLDLAQNDFSSLRNTQFIESRVYEDDETLETSETNKTEEKTLSEEERDQRITNVVLRGLTMMDKFYEKVLVPISDSEEDEIDSSYVLKPKDPYVDRPLTYVIGTEEWYKESHIGLEDSDVESESDKTPELYSSDSDSNISVNSDFSRTKSNVKASDSSSELDFSTKTNPSRPQAHSTFNDSARDSNIFDSNSDEDANSVPIQAPIASKNFAEQLAEKLGNVVGYEDGLPGEEVNRKPIQKVEPKSGFGLFSDEPPPIDDFEEPSNAQSGLFSGGTGLFDDLESSNLITTEKQSTKTKQSAVKNKGLFDSDDTDDETFMAEKTAPAAKKEFLKPLQKTSLPLFDDVPPEIDIKPEARKKPVGGVQLFGSSKVMNDFLKNRRQSSTEESGSEREEKTEPKTEENLVEKISLFGDDAGENSPQKTSLFDDDLFDSDLFSNVTSKKFTSSLFDDDDDDCDTFSDNLVKKNPKVDLFSALLEEEAEKVKKTSPTSKVAVNLERANPDIAAVEDLAVTVESSGDVMDRQVIGAEKPTKTNKSISLFDDEPPSDDDLFKIDNHSNISESLKKSLLFNDDDEFLFSKQDSNDGDEIPDIEVETATPQIKTQKSRASLFDTSPPEDDDDAWDTTDNVFDYQDREGYGADYQQQQHRTESVSLFDSEPPSLVTAANETSGIIADCNATRSDLDADSFNPYASSSRRLSSDIFNDQQSNDSFLVTKNKSEIPTMESIAETSIKNGGDASNKEDSESNVDITPSGDVEDFNSTEEETPKLKPKKTENPTSEKDKLDDKRQMEGTDKADIRSDKIGPQNSESKISAAKDRLDKLNSKRGLRPASSKRSKSEKDMNVAALKEKLQNSVKPPVVQMRDKTSTTSPGKLRHSLNIDVNKLLPGMGQLPKKKERPKTEFFDEPDKVLPTKSFKLTTSQSEMSIEKASVEILSSVTKDRPRIQVKRRPSSKRGREILRKSIADFNEEFHQAMKEETDQDVLENTKRLFGSTEEAKKITNEENKQQPKEDTKKNNKEEGEDVFAQTSKKIEDIFNKKFEDDIGSKKIEETKNQEEIIGKKLSKNEESIFAEDSDDSDLFSAKSTSKKVTKPSEDFEDLFGSMSKDAEEDATVKEEKPSKLKKDVFGGSLESEDGNSKNREEKKKDIFDDDDDEDFFVEKKKTLKNAGKSKSIFDDDDDEDDLFGTSSTRSKGSATNEIKKVKKPAVKKLENKEVLDDPLSKLL